MFSSHKSAQVMGVASLADFAASKAGAQAIVDVAAGNADFSLRVAAVKPAALVDALNGKGSFTVFPPTNAVFATIPEKQLAELLKPENRKQLLAIPTYHAVPGKVPAATA